MTAKSLMENGMSTLKGLVSLLLLIFSTLFWGCTVWMILATAVLYVAADWLFRRSNP